MTMRILSLTLVGSILVSNGSRAEDWPQWRGPNRDAKITGFKTPASWPSELKKQWRVTVGDGVATPALVGDRLYVHARSEGKEVLSCLDAGTGKEIWQDKLEARGADGPAQSFAGPRASPTVTEGKVITLGVRGTLSCYDAASGKTLWRKDDYKNSLPRFYTSCSPLVVDGLLIVQLGGENGGAIVAYDVSSGNEKWKWEGDGTAYASPVLQSVAGLKTIVAETAKNIVSLSLSDGKLQWQIPFPVEGGRGYNSATPIVVGPNVIFGGSNRGTRAVRIEKQGDKLVPKELWKNTDNSVIYNTPVVKNNLLFGLSSADKLFCINLELGKTQWSAPLQPSAQAQAPPAKNPPGKGVPPGKGMGGRGIRSQAGYGSIIDAGSVLLALTPAAKLIVFEPSEKEFKQLVAYKVAEGGTFAYPVIDGNRIFIKDKDSLTLWTLE